MARWITIDVKCEECEGTWDLLTTRELMDDYHLCPHCEQEKGKRTISIPNVTRASYPDGRRDKHSEDLRAIAKLEVAKAQARPEQRAEIKKEINERKKL